VSKGHDLVRKRVAENDRYPTVELELLKLAEEVGELVQAYLRDGTDLARIRREFADVGFVLLALGDRLGLDLDDEIERKFG
jgi:NTP pyrophosphatase (non-canonical NTP hydrolase)